MRRRSVSGSSDANLYATERGSGPPLLLIQGLGYATWAWAAELESFSRTWRTIAFDNRGAGRSATVGGPTSIEQMADDAARILVERDAAPAHVLGFSMGGYIAQALALSRPKVVRSLVLVGTSCGGPDALPVPEDTLRQWLANAGRPPEAYARATMHLSFSPGWTDAHPRRYEELLSARLEFPTSPEAWRAQYVACEKFLEQGAAVERIGVPTLVLHGDEDRVVPLENGLALAERIPGARFAALVGRGHVAHLEDPATFHALVAGFLTELDLRP